MQQQKEYIYTFLKLIIAGEQVPQLSGRLLRALPLGGGAARGMKGHDQSHLHPLHRATEI